MSRDVIGKLNWIYVSYVKYLHLFDVKFYAGTYLVSITYVYAMRTNVF